MNQKIKLTDTILTEGFPCHKFILRKLSSINEAQVFTKNYVLTMQRAGVSNKDIAASLPFLSFHANELNGTYRFDMWEHHIQGFDLIEDIAFDNDVATYKTCRQYYKLYDVKCTACALCPLFNKYKNKFEDSEKQVIRYCLDTRGNIDYVLSKGITSDMFTAVVDVTVRKTAATKPCLYPFLKQTFEALMHNSEVRNAIYEENIDFDMVLEKYHANKVAKLGAIAKDCTISVNTFCAVMISEQLPDTACTQQELEQHLKNLLPEYDNTNALSSLMTTNKPSSCVKLNSNCNLGLEKLGEFYEGKVKRTVKAKTDESKSISLKNKDNYKTLSLDDIMATYYKDTDDERKQPADDNTTANTDSTPPDTVKASANKEVPPIDCKTDTKVPDTEIVVRNAFFISGVHKKQATENKCFPDIRIEEIPMNDNLAYIENGSLISIPVIAEQELLHFSLDLDNGNSKLLTMFESYVLKDKRLSMELVQVDSKFHVLLMYSPKMHAYFHTTCNKVDVREIVSMLLSYPSIVKFCYSPYVLLSVLRQLHIQVKNLWSLYSMSAVMYKHHHMPMHSVLMNMGAYKAQGGAILKVDGEINSVVLNYMHCYHNVFQKNKNILLKKGLFNEYEEQNTFDLVLGMSYYQSLYSRIPDYLFKLKSAGGYVFRNKLSADYKVNGKAFYIHFRHHSEENQPIIMWLLNEMYKCGLFHSCELLLLSLHETFLSLFVTKDYYDYVDTRVNRILLKHLKENRLRGMEYYTGELFNDWTYSEHMK